MTTPQDNTTGIPNPYEDEARERWGHTDAYKESQKRVKNMSKEEFARIGKEGDELMKKIAAVSEQDPASPEVQELVAQHYANLRHFYEPNTEMYLGLGNMYVEDTRFGAYFDAYKPGLAVFMRDAMNAFCNSQETAK